MGKESENRKEEKPWRLSQELYHEKEDMSLWGVVLFGLVGATATTAAAGKLRRTVDWVYAQLTRAQPGKAKSFRNVFQEEAWRRYNRRMQEEYEEEMERLERIRRMQSVFNRSRDRYKKKYESWRESGPGTYHQQFQRDDWYWKTDASHGNRTDYNREPPRQSAGYMLSHHYSILGLDRMRVQPYSEAEIKKAFRAKAMEFHPDQNQGDKEAAEEKFKQVVMSYEAIKKERRDIKL